jgi:outer membrane protein assembly factor BamB
MHRFVFGLFLAHTLTFTAGAADWFQFRGPTGDGHAGAAKLPTEWDKTKNVTWRKEIPGLGWSSPVVANGKIYLTTAVPGANKGDYSLRAICLDAASGGVVWDVEVFKEDGKKAPPPHSKNSHASPTPVVDGDQVFVHFGHLGTACLSAKDGGKVWATQELKYSPVHGNGGSPVLAGDRLIFNIDGADKQLIAALDRKTGEVAWQTPRNTNSSMPFSFSTPLVAKVGGKDQVISAGSGVVMSLDPKTGEELWRAKLGSGFSVVPKPVYANGLVYVCTGYTAPTLVAIKPDGKGDVTDSHVAWTAKRNVPSNPSVLPVDDAVYMVSDSGTLSCLDAKTGKERWSERVGGAYSASPVYANGLIYLLDEAGTATVVKAGSSFEAVAKNRMGEKALASYGVDGDALLLRTEKALYRIEKKAGK